MLVVAVVPLYPPASRVGAWLATHEYLRHLATRGHTVQVTRYMSRREPSYTLDGVTVTDRRKTAGVSHGADIVISHLGDNGNAHADALRYGVPSVRMIHGPTTEPERLTGAALAVCNSQATRDSLDWDGPTITARPVTVPDLHRTTPGDRVTMVNLSRPKGGELLYPLAAALPEIGFLAVEGGYGSQVRRKAGNVEHRPPTDDMRGDVWSRTRILLVPSEAESWGMVGIEAMCSGIPVVAHPTPGLLESLGDAGIFVDRADLGGWVRELTRLQDPDEWKAASMLATTRADSLDFNPDLDLFATSVEALA